MCVQFTKKWFNTQNNDIRMIIVFPTDCLQTIHFLIKCIEIAIYAKTPMK